jgi:hypothetical protein
MASDPTTIQQVIADAAGPLQSADSTNGVTDQLLLLIDQMQRLQTVQEAATEATLSQTQVVKSITPTSSTSSTSTGDSLGGTVLNSISSGLGLSPLISGILSLFGGGDNSSAPAPLVKFALPSSVNVNAGVSAASDGTAFGVDSAQGPVSRPVTASVPQVTIQVSAMDSRSFLDHSNDIALAVRQAMLESSVLNDVVREA